MDNLKKIPRINAETLGNQRVEIYLNDLNKRFKELLKQHETIIENSVDIIQEIKEVSSDLNFIRTKNNPKIKDLIRGFENGASKDKIKYDSTITLTRSNVEAKTEFVEKSTSAGDLLKESMLVLKQAKESMHNIDAFLDEITEETKLGTRNINPMQTLRVKTHPNYQTRNIDMSPTRTAFSSCFSSCASLNNFRSVEDCKKVPNENGHVSPSFCDIGYQGDIDESEYDLHASKKKREK